MNALSRLLLIPLDDIVVFPNMNVTISADVGDEERVLLVPRHDGNYAKVGTVAEVAERVQLPGGAEAVSLLGLHRGSAGAAHTDAQGRLRVEVDEKPDEEPPGIKTRELEREYRAVVEEILELRGDDGRISSFVRSIREVGTLADTVAYAPEISFEQRIELLEAVDVVERLELAVRLQRERLAELQIRHRIRKDVEDGAQRQQREYILRRQMESIRKELGEDDASVSDDYRRKLTEVDLPDEVREQAEREVARLERMGDQSGESSMIRTYLDWLLAVPWGKRSEERLDPVHAREVLDSDHAGLEDVKERIVEYLAVRKLREERGIAEDKRSGAILTLIGPPGTGKTSVGESIARALNREFVRMSLGGVRDEAEIRGHRRTYIGAMPGSIIRSLRDAESSNPLLLIDEIDKLGSDWRGDPASAMLEVLDPEQNSTFRDHYLDLPFDLSKTLFICTANTLDTVPGPLLDRMDVIQLSGYTEDEKLGIAKRYLVPKQLEAHGLQRGQLAFNQRALQMVIREYTREAGVRNLERRIAALCRKTATQIAKGRAKKLRIDEKRVREWLGAPRFPDEVRKRTADPGVATGLAVTAVGGDVLFFEATAYPGEGKLVVTGQLGEVMQESAQAALSWVRAHAVQLGIEPDWFSRHDVHVHVPAGAVPKDGPSAGVTMATAIVSLVTGRPVSDDVAMTGEITLTGQVLPVGGVREKVLAARRIGVHTVVVPKENEPDLEELPPKVREGLNFVLASTIGEVLEAALNGKRAPRRLRPARSGRQAASRA